MTTFHKIALGFMGALTACTAAGVFLINSTLSEIKEISANGAEIAANALLLIEKIEALDPEQLIQTSIQAAASADLVGAGVASATEAMGDGAANAIGKVKAALRKDNVEDSEGTEAARTTSAPTMKETICSKVEPDSMKAKALSCE